MFYMYSATPFILQGLPMSQKLIEQGYYLPVLRIIGNVTSMMFKQRKVLLNEPRYGWMNDGWMDGGWMDEWVDGWMSWWMEDGWMSGWMDG